MKIPVQLLLASQLCLWNVAFAQEPAKTGKAMFEDIERRMVTPMQQAFRRGDRDAGIGVFMDYVFNNPMRGSR